MNKVVIVTSFANNELILKYKNDIFIGVEKGVKKLLDLGLKPHLAISDFDTFSLDEISKNIDFEIIKLPKEKDYSDTEEAVKKAVELFAECEIVILSSLEGRFDHTYALALLLSKYACTHKISLIDEHNKLYCLNQGRHIINKEDYSYLGLFGFPKTIVSASGVKYKVDNLELNFNETRAISNSFIEDEVNVDVILGTLLVVLSKD